MLNCRNINMTMLNCRNINMTMLNCRNINVTRRYLTLPFLRSTVGVAVGPKACWHNERVCADCNIIARGDERVVEKERTRGTDTALPACGREDM